MNAAKTESCHQRGDVQTLARTFPSQFLDATKWIAPQLRAQGHVEARRQKVAPLCEHTAEDRLAVRRDAEARRQRLATVGAGAAEVLDRDLSSGGCPSATLLFSAKCCGCLRGRQFSGGCNGALERRLRSPCRARTGARLPRRGARIRAGSSCVREHQKA